MSRRPPGFGPRFVAPVLIGPVLNPINTTMISVALVPIARDLRLASSVVIWLVAGLYLASAIAQPTMGKIGDIVGPRKVYLTGLVVVLVAGLLPSVVPGFTGVLIARVLIGIGTSAAYPSAMSLIRDQSTRLAVPTPPTLLSGLSIASQATAAVGPVLGGLLIVAFGWRSIFLVNVPLAILAFTMTVLWVPSDRTRPSRPRTGSALAAIDPVGIVLFAGTLAALLVFLLDLAAGHWWLLGVAGVLAGLLVWWELRRATPFLDLRMLAGNLALTRTYLRQFLVYMSSYSMVYGFSQWLQGAAGYSSDRAGLLQLPTAVLAGVAAVLVARNRALRLPLVLAGVLPCLGGLLIITLSSASPVWLLLCVAGLFGVPQGLASVSNQAALYRQAPQAQLGTAAGLSRTSVYLGAIVSSGVIGLAFGAAAERYRAASRGLADHRGHRGRGAAGRAGSGPELAAGGHCRRSGAAARRLIRAGLRRQEDRTACGTTTNHRHRRQHPGRRQHRSGRRRQHSGRRRHRSGRQPRRRQSAPWRPDWWRCGRPGRCRQARISPSSRRRDGWTPSAWTAVARCCAPWASRCRPASTCWTGRRTAIWPGPTPTGPAICKPPGAIRGWTPSSVLEAGMAPSGCSICWTGRRCGPRSATGRSNPWSAPATSRRCIRLSAITWAYRRCTARPWPARSSACRTPTGPRWTGCWTP